MKNILVLIFLLTAFLACKNEPGTADADSSAVELAETNDPDSGLSISPVKLPDPCTIISAAEFAKLFGIDEASVNTNKADMTGSQGFSESCFITWEQKGDQMGLVIQFMKNPLHGEFDEWATTYIDALVDNGEMGYPDNKANKYTRVEGIGEEAAYSVDMGKYFFRKDNEIIVGLFFRNDSHKQDVKNIGKKVAEVILPKI